uniref:Chromo domain-containing protein n=1 Tax=Plectus sambesii TaxID=2011161 RepID=A0A914UYZ6_9BILA
MQSPSGESDSYPATSSYVSEETFEVEGVVDERVECGQKVYRIRWKGFGPEGDTWEPEDNLSEGCAALLEEYSRSKQLSAQRSAAHTESGTSGVLDVFTLGDSRLAVKKEVYERNSHSRSPPGSSSDFTVGTPIKAEIKEADDALSSVSSTVPEHSKPRKSAGGAERSTELTTSAVVSPKKKSDLNIIAENCESSNVAMQLPLATAESNLESEMNRRAREEKKKNASSATTAVLPPETSQIASNKAATEVVDPPPKKKRGRPRKNPQPATSETPNKEATASKEQESVPPQPKKRKKNKEKEDNEEAAMDGEDSALETDDASTSSRHREDKPSGQKSASAGESNEDYHQRKRRRRTEVDNLYVADRVPDWTEVVLQEGLVGAEETAAGKRVTRRIVQSVKRQIAPSASSSPSTERSSTRPRRRRDHQPNYATENNDPTSRESSEQSAPDKQDRAASPSAPATDNGRQEDAVVEASADNNRAKKASSNEPAVPPVLVDRKQAASSPANQVPSIPTVAVQDNRDPAQTAIPNDHPKPQQPTEEPPHSGFRRRPITDANLPLSVSFGLDLNQEFKRRMKLYQLDKGQPVRQSAFERACIEGDLAVVRNAVLALKNKQQPLTLDVNAFDRAGFTLLMKICMTQCSAAHQHDDIIEYLVQAGADVNFRHSESGQFALHLAVNANSLCKVKKLISLKAAVNVADRSGVTPLVLAAQFNRQHIVFALLEFGADYNADIAPDRRSGERRTALRVAEEAGHSSTAGVILSHSRRVKEHFDTARMGLAKGCYMKRANLVACN